MSRRLGRVITFGSALTVALGASVPVQAHDVTERVSVGTGGVQGNSDSGSPALSADGRVVAFNSCASNLVPRDTNDTCDIFVRDRKKGTTRRVSVGPGGAQGDGLSFCCQALSADGRFVAFLSEATNLVAGDTNSIADVFVRDRTAGTTERVNLAPGGIQANGASASDVALSADGRFVAFSSEATNLVAGDANGAFDVFVRDRTAERTWRVSVGPSGREGDGNSAVPTVSADGRFVAFASFATNLVERDRNREPDIFVRDRKMDTTQRVSLGPRGSNGFSEAPAISGNGRIVAFLSGSTNLVPGDTNGVQDVFVYNRKKGTTTRVSVGPGGSQANFGSCCALAISADGRFVAFSSDATNLVAGDTNGAQDVFVHDRKSRTTRRVSVGPGGVEGNGTSQRPAISADGRVVAFSSFATNLTPGDTNGSEDVFARVLAP